MTAEFQACTDPVCPLKGKKHAHAAGYRPATRLVERVFMNERGRRIHLTVDRVARGGEAGVTEITVKMSGPTSTMDNTITLDEARELMIALRNALPSR